MDVTHFCSCCSDVGTLLSSRLVRYVASHVRDFGCAEWCFTRNGNSMLFSVGTLLLHSDFFLNDASHYAASALECCCNGPMVRSVTVVVLSM